jgi:hypothetical protein
MNLMSVRRIIFWASCCAAFSGCTTLVYWSPVYKGVELDRAISLNIEGVALKVSRFGLWNASRNPEAHIVIKNFSDQPFQYDPKECRLRIGDKELAPAAGDLEIVRLLPKEKARVKIRFHFSYDLGKDTIVKTKHGDCIVRSPTDAVLVLGQANLGETRLTLPSIDYHNSGCKISDFL